MGELKRITDQRFEVKKKKAKERKLEGKENQDSTCTWPTESRNPKLLFKKI